MLGEIVPIGSPVRISILASAIRDCGAAQWPRANNAALPVNATPINSRRFIDVLGKSLGTHRFQRALGKKRIDKEIGLLPRARWKRCVPRSENDLRFELHDARRIDLRRNSAECL